MSGSALTLTLVTMLSLAACSDGAPTPLALYPASAEGHNALVEGSLQLEGECLYIAAAGGERWLAAFPTPGTTWDATRQVVRVGEHAVPVGEVAEFAGGETRRDASGVEWVEPPGEACDRSGIWWVTRVTDPHAELAPGAEEVARAYDDALHMPSRAVSLPGGRVSEPDFGLGPLFQGAAGDGHHVRPVQVDHPVAQVELLDGQALVFTGGLAQILQ